MQRDEANQRLAELEEGEICIYLCSFSAAFGLDFTASKRENWSLTGQSVI